MNVKAAIENYFAIIAPSGDRELERITKLIASLDELAFLSNKVAYTFDERNYPEPPEREYKSVRNIVGSLFPSLGLYNVTLDVSDNVAQTTLAIGDAIDDIVDIAGDLSEVLWRFNNTSEDDALFYFRDLFRIHWGRHLRELQLLLHDKFV